MLPVPVYVRLLIRSEVKGQLHLSKDLIIRKFAHHDQVHEHGALCDLLGLRGGLRLLNRLCCYRLLDDLGDSLDAQDLTHLLQGAVLLTHPLEVRHRH